MENTRKLLDEVKAKAGLTSDNALANALGVRRQRVSDYYKGDRAPDNFVCKRIAELLNKPFAVVVAAVEIDVEKDEKRRQAWKDYYKSIGGVAAGFALAVLVGVTTLLTPSPAQAAPMLENASGMICIT